MLKENLNKEYGMNKVKVMLDEEEVKKIFENAEESGEYVINLHKVAFSKADIEWDDIENVCGFVRTNKHTSNLLMEMAIRADKRIPVNKNILIGGTWLNYGFGTEHSVELENWEATMPEVTLKGEQ